MIEIVLVRPLTLSLGEYHGRPVNVQGRVRGSIELGKVSDQLFRCDREGSLGVSGENQWGFPVLVKVVVAITLRVSHYAVTRSDRRVLRYKISGEVWVVASPAKVSYVG